MIWRKTHFVLTGLSISFKGKDLVIIIMVSSFHSAHFGFNLTITRSSREKHTGWFCLLYWLSWWRRAVSCRSECCTGVPRPSNQNSCRSVYNQVERFIGPIQSDDSVVKSFDVIIFNDSALQSFKQTLLEDELMLQHPLLLPSYSSSNPLEQWLGFLLSKDWEESKRTLDFEEALHGNPNDMNVEGWPVST